jgi:hypothetical protein
MAGRHLLMRRLSTLARQLGASEGGRSAPGVASLVQQVCGANRSCEFGCSVPKSAGACNTLLSCIHTAESYGAVMCVFSVHAVWGIT